MATQKTTTTKKTTQRKSATATKLAEQINNAEETTGFQPIPVLSDLINEEKVEQELVKEASKRQYSLDDMIPCKCVKGNKVIYVSTKTGQRYEWNGFGDLCDVMYQDLLSLKSSKSSYIFDPLIVICDDELVEQWSRDLEAIYENFVGIDNPDDFFKMSANEIRVKLSVAPVGLKDTIRTTACKKVKTGELDQLSVIRAIDEVLDTDLQSLLIMR